MESVKNYIMSLAGFSFISSLCSVLLPDIPAKKTVKFVCGIILALLILAPLPGIDVDFSDIFEDSEAYNLYSNKEKMDGLTRNIITDKVCEVVEKTFKDNGADKVMTEVVFDSEGNILAVNIDAYDEKAAKKAAEILGISYEIMHMTE